MATGGQAGTSSRIENYLGFPSGMSGSELAGRAVIQAEKFGARINVPAETALEQRDGHHVVKLDDGSSISARTVVIATGARYRRLGVPRLEQFEETSVYYAATQVEARVCRNDSVVVVGGGNSAGQATLFLAQHAARVRLVVREDALPRNMSRYLVDRIERLGGVEVLLNTEVRELVGDDVLETVVVEDNRTGERRTLDARAMFASASSPTPVGWATSSPWTTRASSSPAPTPPGPMGTTHRGVPVAKANGRDVIQLWDLPITKGLQGRIHEFEDLNEEVELKPILDDLAQRSQLDLACSADTEARLPAIAGGLSLALEAGRRVRARSSAGRLAAGRPTLRGRLHPKRVMAAHRPGGRVPPTAPSGRPLIITAAPSGPVARPSERSTP